MHRRLPSTPSFGGCYSIQLSYGRVRGGFYGGSASAANRRGQGSDEDWAQSLRSQLVVRAGCQRCWSSLRKQARPPALRPSSRQWKLGFNETLLGIQVGVTRLVNYADAPGPWPPRHPEALREFSGAQEQLRNRSCRDKSQGAWMLVP
jgi:hypothetical protein